MNITEPTQKEKDFNYYSSEAAKPTAIAILLLVPALIVLLCSSLILTIKGINVNSIVLKAITPASAALILSGFFFYRARLPSWHKRKIREGWLAEAKGNLNGDFTTQDILDQLPKTGMRDNKQRFLSELKEMYDKKDHKKFDEALKELIKPKGKK